MTWLRSAGLRLVLALGLGFALWVFVSYTRNPDLNTSFDSVPVNITGRSPGLVVVDKDGIPRAGLPPVQVTVETDAETLKNVQQSALRAFVDLNGLGPGEHQVQVNVDSNRSDLKRLSFSAKPEFLPIRLEQEITRTVPLTVEVTGNVPFSFEAGRPRLTVQDQPATAVQVRGPQGLVERVKIVRAIADIDRLTANYSSPRPLAALDAAGQEVKGVTIEPDEVNVLVPIGSSAGIKRVPVLPQVVGQPASGFIVIGVAIDPEFVRLTGSSGPLDDVQNISTGQVDIEGASKTISRTVALQVPANTGLGSGEPNTAIVTVRIEPIVRPFQVTLPVPVQVVDVADALLVSLSPQIVQLTMVGTAGQLAALDPATLQGTVSARGFGSGTYTIEPTFQLPPGVTIVDPRPKVTLTLRLPPSPTPSVTPTEPATPTAPQPTPTELPTASPTLTTTVTVTPAPEP